MTILKRLGSTFNCSTVILKSVVGCPGQTLLIARYRPPGGGGGATLPSLSTATTTTCRASVAVPTAWRPGCYSIDLVQCAPGQDEKLVLPKQTFYGKLQCAPHLDGAEAWGLSLHLIHFLQIQHRPTSSTHKKILHSIFCKVSREFL